MAREDDYLWHELLDDWSEEWLVPLQEPTEETYSFWEDEDEFELNYDCGGQIYVKGMLFLAGE